MRYTRLAEWLRWQESLHPVAIELGLGRVRSVWERLGDRPAPVVITVGGTNGKGSSVAYLDAILRAAGYRTGCYTSPHLVRYNERITIDGEPVSDEVLIAAFQRVDDARGATSLTYFEFGTLAAFEIFSHRKLDVAVLEVGLGGRLDAVNIVDADAALVTTVDIDHARWLGEDREAIGFEKAGIFRNGRPAICGDADPPASLLAAARAAGCPLWVAGRDYSFEATGASEWAWHGGGRQRRGLPLPALRGPHQLRNAAAVVSVLERLAERLPVDQRALREGLLSARIAGRFQVAGSAPRIVLDVAHNPQSARALADNLSQLPRNGRVLAVFGALADKDVAGLVSPLAPLVHRWYLAPLDGARGLSAEALVSRAGAELGGAAHVPGASVADAFARALGDARPEDVVVVFGSFLVIGAVLEKLEAASAEDAGPAC